MSQMFQRTFLDHLDQYQIELEIRPIHQVYSYCNALNKVSVSSCYFWTDIAKEVWYMKYTNVILGFCMIYLQQHSPIGALI